VANVIVILTIAACGVGAAVGSAAGVGAGASFWTAATSTGFDFCGTAAFAGFAGFAAGFATGFAAGFCAGFSAGFSGASTSAMLAKPGFSSSSSCWASTTLWGGSSWEYSTVCSTTCSLCSCWSTLAGRTARAPRPSNAAATQLSTRTDMDD